MSATRESLSAALQAGLDEFGRLDIVVANAGIAPMQSGDDGWRDVIDVNLTGVYNTIKVAIPTMVKQGTGGSIVLISSAAGLAGVGSPDAGSVGYAAAKHGVVGLMRVYANLLAQQSIRVNSIHPTGVETPMINNEFTRGWLATMAAADRFSRAAWAMPCRWRCCRPRTSPTRWRGWCPTRLATSPASPCRSMRAF